MFPWLFGILIGIGLTSAYLDAKSATERERAAPRVIAPGEDVGTRADAVTGCQYLVWGIRGGITPRIAADGKTHMGCKDNTK